MGQVSSNSTGMDFTRGPIMPLLLRFFLPFLLANMLNSLYNTVDTVIIGHLVGNSGIVAASMGGRMLNLYISMSIALAAGGQTLISQLVGAERRDALNATIVTMFIEMAVISCTLALLTILMARNILVWLNTPADCFADALDYLRITSLGLPLLFGYNAASSVLQEMENSKGPLIFIAVAAVANLTGNFVFIIVFGMGVAGTAIAMVIGQGLSLLLALRELFRRDAELRAGFGRGGLRADLPKLRVMLKIGLPMVLRSLSINVTQLVLLGYVNLYRLTQATAYSVGDKVVHMANIFQMAARQAGTSMIGQNIGAKCRGRLKIGSGIPAPSLSNTISANRPTCQGRRCKPLRIYP